MKSWLVFMTKILLGAQTVLALDTLSEPRKESNITRAFRQEEITPDIVPTAPKDVLTIRYQLRRPCLGEEIRLTDIIYSPELIYDTKPGVNYTIILLNLDIPSQVAPALRPVLYWMVVNVPGTNLDGGYTVAAYVPPVNYPGSGCRRSLILVYPQNEQLDIDDLELLRYDVNRFKFPVRSFAEQYNLGVLLAGNFFRTCIRQVKDQFYCQG